MAEPMHGSCEEHGCQWPKGLGKMIVERDRFREALEWIAGAEVDEAGFFTRISAATLVDRAREALDG